MNACSKGFAPDRALYWLRHMKRCGVTADLVSYTIAMDAYRRAKKCCMVQRLFREMEAAGIAANIKVYGILIEAFGESDQCDTAKQFFDATSAAGLTHSLISLSSLINAYTKARRYPEADGLYQRMLQEGMLTHWSTKQTGQMDLHVHSYGTALAAMRLVFFELCGHVSSKSAHAHDVRNGLRIITGHAKNRASKESSIVQSSVLQWLQEQGIQYSTDSNGGRVIISSAELQAYAARERLKATHSK